MTYAEAIKKLRNKMILSQMEFAKLIDSFDGQHDYILVQLN